MVTKHLIKKIKVEKLAVAIFSSREEMGKAAAQLVATEMKKAITQKNEVAMIFTAAPSQDEFLAELIQYPDLDWSKVIAFHIDEYIGLPETAPQRFGNFLQKAIFNQVPFKQIFYIDGAAKDIQQECLRYTELLKTHPVDITCLGIGENGLMAFNDPSVADFSDSALVKVVQLNDISRQQQVNDGCFDSFAEVPTDAITLTIPALFQAKLVSCVVPAKAKARAVETVLTGKISTDCPASILRTHDNAHLFLDMDSAARLSFDS